MKITKWNPGPNFNLTAYITTFFFTLSEFTLAIPFQPQICDVQVCIGYQPDGDYVCLTCFGSCSKSHHEVWCIAVCHSSTASAGRTRTVWTETEQSALGEKRNIFCVQVLKLFFFLKSLYFSFIGNLEHEHFHNFFKHSLAVV